MSRSESLVYAAALFGPAAVLFRILYVASRVQAPGWWAGDRWLADVWAPLIVILLAFGFDFLIDVFR